MKKILIIAQYFPPAGGVGTFRVTKFVKYLREFGWEPIVLTVHKDCHSKAIWLDCNLEKDIPHDIHIYRTKTWRSSYINDEGVKWLPYLISNTISIIRKERPHLIYITGGPFFPLIIGPVVKFLFKLSYVIDLRDPWKLARRRVPIRGLKTLLGRLLTNIAEPIVLRHAAKVICATDTMRKEYQSVYPDKSEKFFTITNGYDPDDFDYIKPKQYEKFTIVYTGKFERGEAFHNPAPVFKALKILQSEGIEAQFIHVGVKEEKVVTLAQKAGMRNAIKFIGPKSHSETLSYAIGADLLLVIGSDRKNNLPVKMFDYIGCHRPILILAYKDEEMWNVGQEIPFATLLENNNSNNIACAIEKIYQNYHRIELAKNMSSKYHRKNLASILSKVFNEVLLTKEKNKGNMYTS